MSQINADWDPRHVGRVFASIGAKIFSNAAGVACGTRSTWRSQCLSNPLWESDSSNAQSDHDSDAAVKREAEYMSSPEALQRCSKCFPVKLRGGSARSTRSLQRVGEFGDT
jgi:hypothetical protein